MTPTPRAGAAVLVLVACLVAGCTGNKPVKLDERVFQNGATGEHLTVSLVVDAHVIGQFDSVGDCGPLGPHTGPPCQGPGEVQLAVSLLNVGTSPEVVPVFEARCDEEHAATGSAPAFKTGDPVTPGQRQTDTITFDLSHHRCPAPVLLVYRFHAKAGDPAIAVPVPIAI
jgi:hypothetical protein